MFCWREQYLVAAGSRRYNERAPCPQHKIKKPSAGAEGIFKGTTSPLLFDDAAGHPSAAATELFRDIGVVVSAGMNHE